ncbi:hypothetical protein LV779_10535 [Streptomyces thinghirensis]|nr:hypothetical protein [Streptomyces thinghirensis]
MVRKGLQDEPAHPGGAGQDHIVFVTHDIDEAIVGRIMVAVMRTGGRLAQFAPPPSCCRIPADDFVEDFLGADRGIRRLSFFPAGRPELTSDRAGRGRHDR